MEFISNDETEASLSVIRSFAKPEKLCIHAQGLCYCDTEPYRRGKRISIFIRNIRRKGLTLRH